jgi:hypothetical protein
MAAKRPLILPSYLDFFSKKPLNLVSESYFHNKIVSDNIPNHEAPIEFSIPSFNNSLICLNSVEVYTKCKIVQKDDTNLAANLSSADDFVSTINSLSSSLFSDINIDVNGTVIDTQNGLYAFNGHVNNILSDHDRRTRNYPTTRLYSEEAAATVDSTTSADAKTRGAYFANGGTVQLIHNLDISIFQNERCLPPDTKVNLKFFPNKGSFVILSKKADGYRIAITEMYLIVKYLKCEPNIYLNILERMNHESYSLSFIKQNVTSHLIPANISDTYLPNIIRGPLPALILFTFTDNNFYNYLSSPLNFKPYDLNGFSFQVNSEILPSVAPKFSFKNANDHEMHHYVMKSLGINNTKNIIDLDRFRDGFFLASLNLNDDSLKNAHTYPQKNGIVNLSLSFEAPTPNALSLLIWTFYPAYLKIDKSGDVKIEI